MMSQSEGCELIFDDVSQVYLAFGKFTEFGKPQVIWNEADWAKLVVEKADCQLLGHLQMMASLRYKC